MSNLGYEVLASARERVGAPFRHHYRPDNICQGGRTTQPECMERGLEGTDGYDCSGLVIASLCEVIGISYKQWPRGLRHTRQMVPLQSDSAGMPGDLRLFKFENGNIHLGIAATDETIVHASIISGEVEEGELEIIDEPLRKINSIAIDSLYKAARGY